MKYKLKNGKWNSGNLLSIHERDLFNTFIINEKIKLEKRLEKKRKKQHLKLLKKPILSSELVVIPKDLKKFNYQFNFKYRINYEKTRY